MIAIQILAALLIFVGGLALMETANGPSFWANARGVLGFVVCLVVAPLFLVWSLS